MTAEHDHTFVPWVTFHHAPTGPYPNHTSFTLLVCRQCGEYHCWPHENFALCTPAFQRVLDDLARQMGATLVRDFAPRSLPRST
jgi:hypothetical protein